MRHRERQLGDVGVQAITVAAVTEDQSVLGILKRKAFGDTLNGIYEPLADFGHHSQIFFLYIDSSVAEKPKRLSHTVDLISPCGRQRRA
jgi:hypothetical protein